MNTFLKVGSCVLLLQASLGQAFAAPADPFMTEKQVAALATASALEDALEKQCNFSAPPAQLELPETIARALCQNPQTRGAWAKAQAHAPQVGVAKSAYLPSAAASFGYSQQNSSNRYESYPVLDSKTTPKTRSGSLKMSWTIADSGLRSANLEQANALLDAANASHDFTIQNTFLAAAQAYFDAQMASAVLKATREAEHSAQQSLNATEAKYAAGVGALSDTLQVAVALSDARLKRVTAEGELKNAIGALSTAIGLPPYTQLKLPERSDVLPDTSFVKSAEELFTEAREHHPALLAARSEVQAAQARIKATQAEGRPSVTFSAEANDRRQDNYLPAVNIAPTQAAFRDKVMGVQLNIPLFEGFGRGYKERAASSQADIKAGVAVIVG